MTFVCRPTAMTLSTAAPHTISDETVLLVGGDLCHHALPLIAQHTPHYVHLRRSAPDPTESHRVQADVSDPASLLALPAHIDRILYAITPDDSNEAGYRKVFIEGVANLLDALKQRQGLQTLKRFVFVSSTAVYGGSSDWVDEHTPEQPERFNGQVLLAAEQALRSELGSKAVAIRPSGLYGPGRSHLLNRLREGKVQIAETPLHWANRLHLQDAARACVHLLYLDQPQGVYIATDDTPMPLGTLYDGLADLLGVAHPPRTGAPLNMASKKLRATRLKASGFTLQWPDTLKGYAELIQTGQI